MELKWKKKRVSVTVHLPHGDEAQYTSSGLVRGTAPKTFLFRNLPVNLVVKDLKRKIKPLEGMQTNTDAKGKNAMSRTKTTATALAITNKTAPKTIAQQLQQEQQ